MSCNNLSCVTDTLAEWRRLKAVFYWSVWVDHASHCLPQTKGGGGGKKRWRNGEMEQDLGAVKEKAA